MRKIIAAILAVLTAGAAAGSFERAAAGPQKAPAHEAPLHQGGYLNAYIALLKSDLKSRRAGFMTEGLHLSDKEAAVFWPIFRSYESDLKRLDDERLRMIKDYTDHFDRMTDAKAREKIERRLALEEHRVNLERTYFKRLSKVLPGKTVARFFQLDYRFDLLMDLKNTAEVPLIELAPSP
jgi:hypothetical protein